MSKKQIEQERQEAREAAREDLKRAYLATANRPKRRITRFN